MQSPAKRIALDAMGCDYGPATLVEGALLAIERGPYEIALVGKEGTLARLLRERGYEVTERSRITLIPAADVVTMHDTASEALRKRESSIHVAALMVRDGLASGLVSAGNTGATMATTKVLWRSLPGVSRPAIATIIPSQTHPCILLDIGANVDCRPRHLLHFAIMGSVYAKELLKRPHPRIGLLNIGEEDSKGNALTAGAFDLLRESRLNFVGNVEGRDILNGRCDVIVCDGFVGNVILKFGEALAEHILSHLKGKLKSSLLASLAALAIRPTFRAFKEQLDPDEFGGAPLLGVNGVCIICHGATTPKAIMNAIRVAHEFVDHKVNQQIVDEIANTAPAPEEAAEV